MLAVFYKLLRYFLICSEILDGELYHAIPRGLSPEMLKSLERLPRPHVAGTFIQERNQVFAPGIWSRKGFVGICGSFSILLRHSTQNLAKGRTSNRASGMGWSQVEQIP